MKFLLGCIALLNVCCVSAKRPAAVLFKPDSPEIVYQGRIDFSDPLKPRFCHTGVNISAVIYAQSISIVMEDLCEGEKYTNYYAVIVDGKELPKLEAKRGKHTYVLSTGLALENHHVVVFKRTECEVGSSVFYGFEAPAGSKIFSQEKNNRSIEFIGNSLTCGYGNEAAIAAPPQGNPNVGFHSANENGYAAYGSITARMLNADYCAVAYSGRGVYRNNTGNSEGTIPKIYSRIFPDDENSKTFDFSKKQPGVIVIALGGNDFFPESTGDFLDDSAFVKTYLDFLTQLRKRYPNAVLICCVNNLTTDNWPEGRKCRTRLTDDTKVIVNKRLQAGDKAIHFFNKWQVQSAPYGEDWHPSLLTHQKMADILAPFIGEVMGWE